MVGVHSSNTILDQADVCNFKLLNWQPLSALRLNGEALSENLHARLAGSTGRGAIILSGEKEHCRPDQITEGGGCEGV